MRGCRTGSEREQTTGHGPRNRLDWLTITERPVPVTQSFGGSEGVMVVPRSRAILLAVILISGCGGRHDREPLTRCLEAIDGTLRQDFEGELRGFPAGERGMRRLALRSRSQVAAIDDFLAGSPALTASGREAADALRATCAAQAELFEGVVREGRFKLTPPEHDRFDELMAEFQQRVERIGRMIDGKE